MNPASFTGRGRVAGGALVLATLVAAAGASMGGTGPARYAAVLYLALTGYALARPSALVVQVVFGQALVATVLFSPSGQPVSSIVALVAVVVATAELVGIAGRLDVAIDRHPGPELRRAGLAVPIAMVAFVVVFAAGSVPGPGGLIGVALSTGACVGLAVVLVRRPSVETGS